MYLHPLNYIKMNMCYIGSPIVWPGPEISGWALRCCGYGTGSGSIFAFYIRRIILACTRFALAVYPDPDLSPQVQFRCLLNSFSLTPKIAFTYVCPTSY